MYALKEFQERAVQKLCSYTYEALKTHEDQIQILLEAPTGSGKTIMMAEFLERLVEELKLQPGLNDNVAFIWFAPNTLHIQSFLTLQKLYEDSCKVKCMDLNYLTSNPVLHPADLLFVNWSSVDGQKKIWRKQNETNTNLETLVENTNNNGTKIILVIDEAHLSAFTGPQAIKVRQLINAKVEVMVTATPKQRPQRSVSILRQEVIAEQMIKKSVRLNIGLDPNQQNGENVHIHLMRKAFEKQAELKKLYDAELGVDVLNPLILIQLPSETESLTEEDKSLRDILVRLLEFEYGITTNNGRLAIWLSGERDKDGLEAMNGLQDVLLFKQAIAQGWDCPRAAILVSYRNIQNVNFGIQTVGRILRMPHQRHYDHDDLNYGYVFSNIESARINFVPSDADYFNLQYAKRQDNKGWVFDRMNNNKIVNDRINEGVLTLKFKRMFFDVMEHRYGLFEIPEIDVSIPESAEIAERINQNNRRAFIENGWVFDIDEHQIIIPTDIDIDPYQSNCFLLSNDQMHRFSITTAQFQEMMNRFCYESITQLNRSKSWKLLRSTLIEFAEYYFAIDEFACNKLFLFPQNKVQLYPLIQKAMENYVEFMKAKGNKNRRLEEKTWEVPEFRYYSEFYTGEIIENHALMPFYETLDASNPEKQFKELLAQSSDEISWWYKNGDQGKEHFSIVYTNLQGEIRLFYLDFVIKFNSGVIGLFDTKTKRSDLEAPNKHNALLDYIENELKVHPDKEMIGGVLIAEIQNGLTTFRYCTHRINDTNDLTGWNFFNAQEINKNN